MQIVVPSPSYLHRPGAQQHFLRVPILTSVTNNPIAELVMSLIHGYNEKYSEYPGKFIHRDEEDYGPYSSPPSNCESLSMVYFFKAALSTIIVMLAVAALTWQFYTPPSIVV